MRRLTIKIRRRFKVPFHAFLMMRMVFRICYQHGQIWGEDQQELLERKLYSEAMAEARRLRSYVFRVYAKHKRSDIQAMGRAWNIQT